MRQIGVIGVFTAFVAFPAYADDGREPCPGLFAGKTDDPSVQGDQLLLTDNQCEAVAKRELRVPLLEIPQDGEDPMSLSFGAKNVGGILRFKIPFSF